LTSENVDRTDLKRGGVVALYINNDISFKVLAKSVAGQPVDFIFADVKFFHTRVLVGVIYCPPGIDGYPYYGPVFKLSNRYPRHMLMGDFNVNLLGDSTSSRCFVWGIWLS
jgi:hypothetical protein